ncbi:hypothetical protein [Aquabacterium sp.]|uniref:hypothetical protein n=1 Tax=Aquabacterium sp. TaxID=1872578 RepID=UPI0025C22CCF|nr:hypothetical protein [Aquabacterium sp.]
MLVSSSLLEDDYPVWDGGATYAVGDRRILLSNHTVYERITAGVSAASPDLDTVHWERVGPTNKWAMFDRATGTASSASDSLTVTIAPGMVRGLALLDVTGNSVTVTMTNGSETVYSRTVNLNTGYGVTSWDTYFFTDIVRKRTVVLEDVPPYSSGLITITINGSGPVSVGTVVTGHIYRVGNTRYGMGLGFTDYSVKDTSKFGETTVVERAYAKNMSVPFVVRDADVDWVLSSLESIRATAVVWIGARRYDSSVIYGYAKDARLVISYEQASECSVTIEGLI